MVWKPGFGTQTSGGLTFFFVRSRQPKAIFEANLIRKLSILNKENCVWKFAVFNLDLLKVWWSGGPLVAILFVSTFSWKTNFRYTNLCVTLRNSVLGTQTLFSLRNSILGTQTFCWLFGTHF